MRPEGHNLGIATEEIAKNEGEVSERRKREGSRFMKGGEKSVLCKKKLHFPIKDA